uniref:Vegetative incompatibility protein HET-E-1-like n=1 Tax=Sinocyclocheilus grahami TaxID=75366 RepID=A0A672M609_SINGR
MGEVRKLQKKLRQIENLEIKISLTLEEKIKVSKKGELRSRLAELLLQHSGPQQIQGIVGKEEDKMKRQVEEVTEQLVACRPALKIAREERRENERIDGSQTDGRGETHLPVSPSAEEQEDAEFKSRKQTWEKAKFRLRTLEGHSDIITCAVAVDNLVISGSRDTTVKVWHVPTATEQRNLGGHSGGVTCLSAPPLEYCRRLARVFDLAEKERFVLSGSTDCCVRIWALSSGQCVKSIYTFNAVSSLCFTPEGEGFIVTGSGSLDISGLQVWSWSSLENCQSENAHLDAVTTLQSQGPLLFSGSAEGCVCVWEVSDERTEPLRRLHVWGPEVTGCGGDDGRLILSPRGDRVFLSCGKASIRILNWRTGVMTRLTNHSSTAGVTDCVNQIPGLLIGSCFDIINGESTINLFSLPQSKYLVSLTSSDLPRILCFAAWLTASGDHRWVTGGRNLIVWEQLPGSFKKRCVFFSPPDIEECSGHSLIDNENRSSHGVLDAEPMITLWKKY